MQGEGHGPAVHDFDLDAEQVVEAQVILADGRLVIASPCQNPDLFFVIRDEGGSTYEVVVFTVIKAHSTNIFSVQKLSFAPLTPTDMPAFVSALQTIHGFFGYDSWYVSYFVPVVANYTTCFTHTIAIFGKSKILLRTRSSQTRKTQHQPLH